MISVCAVLAEAEQQHGGAGEPGGAACSFGQHTHGPQEWPSACSWHLLWIQTAVPLVRALLPVRRAPLWAAEGSRDALPAVSAGAR